jgi:hypothetical protein
MSKWLKEPLLHFIVLGAAIFLVFGAVSEKGSSEKEIFISKGQQENLLNTFSRTWQRLPTPEEYQGLVKDYLRQEIAYRESREMGLDQDDIVIRRRLRQKMEMLAEDVAGLVPPTDAELQAYLEANPGQFMTDPRMTLRQVYFSTDKRGESAGQDALDTLAVLREQGEEADVLAAGDTLPLPQVLQDVSAFEISRLFGPAFVERLETVEPAVWTGPVQSGYGLHLVFVTDRVDSRLPKLDEIRPDVEREFMSLRRQDSVDGLYEKLAENYSIEIEPLTEGGLAETEAQ